VTVPDDVVDGLGSLPAANIGDSMDRLNVLDGAIRPMWAGAKLAGRAVTVYLAGGDNKGIHEVLPTLQPGDVLVVNGQGVTHRALIGELIAGRAAKRGCRGFVIDGAVRDVEDLAEIGFPVFARAASPAGPYRNGPFQLAVPVAIGGVVVSPGDVVVGDGDGVVVVPAADAAEVLERAQAKHRAETEQRQAI